MLEIKENPDETKESLALDLAVQTKAQKIEAYAKEKNKLNSLIQF